MAARPAALISPHRAAWEELEHGAREAEEAVGVEVRSIAIGDVRFELRFAGGAMLKALYPALAHLQREPSGEANVRVTLWDTRTSGVPPPASRFQPGDVVSRGGELGAGGDPAIQVLAFPGLPVVMVWDAERESAVVWAADAAVLPGFERASPLRTLLQWALEPYEIYFVHGACVANDDIGVLIGGLSGAGKSTTSVACIRLGLGFVGDDYVALAGADEPVAWSLYSTAKLDERSVELLDGLEDVPRGVPGDNPPKETLLLDQAPEARLLHGARLGAVVLPARSAPEGLRPARPATALRTLAAPSVLQIPRDAQAAIGHMSGLVQRLPVYELGLAGGPAHAARHVAGLLETLGGR